MTWTYLQGPSDGTVFLEWQPASQRQSRFASDGYVWADAESAFTMDVRGYVSALSMSMLSEASSRNQALELHSANG